LELEEDDVGLQTSAALDKYGAVAAAPWVIIGAAGSFRSHSAFLLKHSISFFCNARYQNYFVTL
jgi:hypothetical protein